MSNLLTTPQWHEDINQVDVTEPIVGGDGGNMNLATRQLAESLAWLKQQIENNPIEAYQVGDIYTTTLNHASSAEVAINKGYGTWARYAEGRTLVGMIDIPDYVGRYSSIGNEFGENEHQLTVAEMPSHKHGNGVALDSLTNQDIAAGFRGTQPISTRPHVNRLPRIRQPR